MDSRAPQRGGAASEAPAHCAVFLAVRCAPEIARRTAAARSGFEVAFAFMACIDVRVPRELEAIMGLMVFM